MEVIKLPKIAHGNKEGANNNNKQSNKHDKINKDKKCPILV